MVILDSVAQAANRPRQNATEMNRSMTRFAESCMVISFVLRAGQLWHAADHVPQAGAASPAGTGGLGPLLLVAAPRSGVARTCPFDCRPRIDRSGPEAGVPRPERARGGRGADAARQVLRLVVVPRTLGTGDLAHRRQRKIVLLALLGPGALADRDRQRHASKEGEYAAPYTHQHQ